MADFPEKAEDNVNVLTTVIIGGVSTIVLWASVIALQAYYDSTGGELEQVRAVENQARALRQARAEHLADLADYRYIDAKTGTVKLPIERAMTLVSEDARQGKGSLVPSVGSHDTPTVPLPGQKLVPLEAPTETAPPEDGAAPPEGADGAAAPDGAAVSPNDATAQPGDGGAAAEGTTTARAADTPAAPAEEGSAN